MTNDPPRNHLPPLPPENVSAWQASNAALAALLARHRPSLAAAVAAAEAIGRGIDDLAPVMADLCRRTCRFCPEPCCITNTVWFDFKDLLFFHLLDAPVPERQALSDTQEACPFLRPHGCRLPPRGRPWMCIQYLCPAQLAILERLGRPLANSLRHTIAAIEDRRARMEARVVHCIRRRRQRWAATIPSASFSADRPKRSSTGISSR